MKSLEEKEATGNPCKNRSSDLDRPEEGGGGGGGSIARPSSREWPPSRTPGEQHSPRRWNRFGNRPHHCCPEPPGDRPLRQPRIMRSLCDGLCGWPGPFRFCSVSKSPPPPGARRAPSRLESPSFAPSEPGSVFHGTFCYFGFVTLQTYI